jgi:U4/U6 small nuclear ribonucleoprotein PRP31
MSLADSLLADLEGFSDDEEPTVEESNQASSSTAGAQSTSGFGNGKGAMLPPALPVRVKREAEEMDVDDDDEDDENGLKLENGTSAVGFVPEGGVRPADELDEDEVAKVDMTGVEDVGKVAKLMSGKKLRETLAVSVW